MSTPRLLRFGSPQRALRVRQATQPIIEPTLGLDQRSSPMDLQPGATPASQNFVKFGGTITPRSGLSGFGDGFSLGGPAFLGMSLYDTEGQRYALAVSANTFGWLPAEETSWSTLSYVTGSVGTYPVSADTFSASRYVGAAGAYIYDILTDANIAIITNHRQLPKFFSIDTATTTFSDFTWPISFFSRARCVEAYDDRLVWFNVASSASSFPTRIAWSVRGSPKDYTLASGAGYEDRMDMKGSGTRLITDGDELVLFTESEIWRARKRGDIYAFDFYPVHRSLGCILPRTVCATPAGVAFLGTDMQAYILNGSSAVPLDQTQDDREGRSKEYIRRLITNSSTAWAQYNSQTHMYELYFASRDGSSLYPTTALYFSLDNSSVWPQKFTTPLTAGFPIIPHYEGTTWDELTGTWDELDVTWDELSKLNVREPRSITISSKGTPFAFHPSADSDAGETLDARWASHGLALDPTSFDYTFLSEVWAEYAADSASSASIWISTDGGATYATPYGVALSASSASVAYFPTAAQARGPQFEVRVTNGKPRFSRFRYKLGEGSAH